MWRTNPARVAPGWKHCFCHMQEIGGATISEFMDLMNTTTISLISYATATIFYCALALYLVVSWQGGIERALLVLAVLITSIWSATAAYFIFFESRVSYTLYFFEVLRNLFWIAFLQEILVRRYRIADVMKKRLHKLITIVGAVCLTLLIFYVYQYANSDVPLMLLGVDATKLGYIILAATGLFLVERILRGPYPERRTVVKLMYIGIGGIFVYDLAMYTQALISGGIQQIIWDARGMANLLIVPVLAVASSMQRPRNTRKIYVSHQMVLNITILFIAVVYLAILGFAASVVRHTAGGWGSVGEVVLLMGGGLLLAGLLFSERLRSYLKVVVSKHFFDYKYDYREEWLRFIRTLSKGGAGAHLLERAIQSIAQIVDSPGGALWLNRDPEQYDLVAKWGTVRTQGKILRADSRLVSFLEETQWVIDIKEVQDVPSRYTDLAIPDEIGDIPYAWLIVPLIQDVHILGFIVLLRPGGRRHINWEDRDLLKTAGRQAATHIVQLMATQALTEARELHAFSKLSAFIVHDLKNVVAQLSLVVANSRKHKHNPEFMDDAICTVENAVSKMERLLSQLHHKRARSATYIQIEIASLLRKVIDLRAKDKPVPVLKCADSVPPLWADPDRLVAVLEHVVQNAQEATPPDGSVTISLHRDSRLATIDIQDSGCGMDEEFVMEKLFRPFSSTKGDDGMGIGAFECREYVRELGGLIEVDSKPGVGTRFTIQLPLDKQPPA